MSCDSFALRNIEHNLRFFETAQHTLPCLESLPLNPDCRPREAEVAGWCYYRHTELREVYPGSE